MNLPPKRQRFTEEELKIVQEFYKRMPQAAQTLPQYNFFPQAIPAWSPLVPPIDRRPVPSPDSLKNYITRAFSKCTSDVERDLMEKLIKDVISEKKNSGSFNMQDWDRTELPMLPREQVVVQPQVLPQVVQQIIPKRNEANQQIGRRKTRFEPIEIEEDYRPSAPIPMKKQKVKEEEAQSEWKIVGTCKDLEKPYFRLAAKPDPATIRPEHVLKKALAWLKDRWRKGEIKYEYFSGQLRSIRQDLTVQGIRDKFSVEIYQVHTRLSLEAQDLDQYNSCMSRLFELYKEGLPGRIPVRSKQEFKAYQIMYYTLQNLYIQLEKCLKTLNENEKKSQEIKQAMALKSALIIGNYHQVFQIRPTLMHYGSFLLDIFMPKLRVLTLIKMCKAYQPSVSIETVGVELGFSQVRDAEVFVKENGGVIVAGCMECKPSVVGFRDNKMFQTKS